MPKIFERIAILKQTSVFSEISTDDLRIVAANLQEEIFMAGDHVFDINDRSDQVYFICSGKVGISIGPDPKKTKFVNVLGPKECFGEMSMFDDKPRSATAQVVEDCLLLTLDKVKLRGLLSNYPELALGMLRTLSMRLRDTTSRLDSDE